MSSARPFQLESSIQDVSESRLEASVRPIKAEVTFDLKSPSSSGVGKTISWASSGAVGIGALIVISCAVEAANRAIYVKKAFCILNYAAKSRDRLFKPKASYSY